MFQSNSSNKNQVPPNLPGTYLEFQNLPPSNTDTKPVDSCVKLFEQNKIAKENFIAELKKCDNVDSLLNYTHEFSTTFFGKEIILENKEQLFKSLNQVGSANLKIDYIHFCFKHKSVILLSLLNELLGSIKYALCFKKWVQNKDNFSLVSWASYSENYSPSEKFQSLISYAIAHNWYEGVEALIKLGANTKQNDYYSFEETTLASDNIIRTFKRLAVLSTPVLSAVKAKNEAIVKLLIEHGADINQPDNDGAHDTPLHIAVKEGMFPIIKLLIDAKADVNPTNAMGALPLTYARDYTIAKFLIKNNASTIQISWNNFVAAQYKNVLRNLAFVEKFEKRKTDLTKRFVTHKSTDKKAQIMDLFIAYLKKHLTLEPKTVVNNFLENYVKEHRQNPFLQLNEQRYSGFFRFFNPDFSKTIQVFKSYLTTSIDTPIKELWIDLLKIYENNAQEMTIMSSSH